MATIVEPAGDRKAAERKFYSRMAILLVVVVFIGFAPSFYLKDIVPSYPRPNPTLPPAVLLHGLTFTLWMALLVVQTQLISTRRVETHMKLGKAAMLLAIALIPVILWFARFGTIFPADYEPVQIAPGNLQPRRGRGGRLMVNQALVARKR